MIANKLKKVFNIDQPKSKGGKAAAGADTRSAFEKQAEADMDR